MSRISSVASPPSSVAPPPSSVAPPASSTENLRPFSALSFTIVGWKLLSEYSGSTSFVETLPAIVRSLIPALMNQNKSLKQVTFSSQSQNCSSLFQSIPSSQCISCTFPTWL